jgi:hypothetical protein
MIIFKATLSTDINKMNKTFDLQCDITKNDIYQICQDLECAFHLVLHEDNYKFVPLKRLEGGIECICWPKRKQNESKQIKFTCKQIKWPWITAKWKKEWKGNNEIIVNKLGGNNKNNKLCFR